MNETSLSFLRRLSSDRGTPEWEDFLGLYHPFISAQIRLFPSLASQSNDIAQEVMAVVAKELPKFERQRTGSFRKWLRIVTLNRIRATIQSNKRFPNPIGGVSELEFQISQWEDPASIASKRWDEEHDQRVMVQAMNIVRKEVDPKTWTAFERYALKNEEPRAIADELGCEVNSIYLAKSRIIRRLKEEVAGLID